MGLVFLCCFVKLGAIILFSRFDGEALVNSFLILKIYRWGSRVTDLFRLRERYILYIHKIILIILHKTIEIFVRV